MSTFYDVLGVAPDAEEAVIRQTFRELAKAYHPDIHGVDGPSQQTFKKMTAAYAVLKNPKTRAAYDARLALGYRLSRRRKYRDLMFCAVAAIASFSAVSSALLHRDTSASARDLEPARAVSLPTWQAELSKREAALAASPALPESPALPLSDREAAPPTSIARLATPLPTFPARDPAPPTAARFLSEPAKTPTVDVRVWVRATDTGLNGSSRYVAKIFQVQRERANRPFGRLDLLSRPAD